MIVLIIFFKKYYKVWHQPAKERNKHKNKFTIILHIKGGRIIIQPLEFRGVEGGGGAITMNYRVLWSDVLLQGMKQRVPVCPVINR